MGFEVNKINILYKGVYLQTINLTHNYSIDDIKKQFSILDFEKYNLSIKNITKINVLDCDIKQHYLLDIELCCIKIYDSLNDLSKRIIKYLDVLDCLSNSSFIDQTVPINNKMYFISYTRIIAERNYEILKRLLISYINDKNLIVCYYFLRDLIENVKLYLYFIKGDKKETIVKSNRGTTTYEKIDESITKKIKDNFIEGKSWDFKIKDIFMKIDSLKSWENEMLRILKINDVCDKYIHKNGLEKIITRLVNENKNSICLEDFFLVIKFFFTLIACYEGKEISSDDYISYLDNDEEPPEGSQYWVANIYREFIESEYTKEEIEKLRNCSYMDI